MARKMARSTRLARWQGGRVVTEEQRKMAEDFFGPSVDYTKVKIKESRFGSAGRPWTCGNVIRTRKPTPAGSGDVNTADLIHEYAHVWQHQHGQIVLLKAAVEQIGQQLPPHINPYNFGGPVKVVPPSKLSGFKTEGQAQIVAEYWKSQNGEIKDMFQNEFSPEYSDDLRRLVQEAGVGSTLPGKTTVLSLIDSAVGFVVNAVLGLFD
jgi:hypothetical protein